MLNSDRHTSIFTRALAWLIIFVLASVCTIIVVAAPPAVEDEAAANVTTIAETDSYAQTEPVIELNNTPVVFSEVDYTVFYDYQMCIAYLDELKECLQVLYNNIASDTYTEEALVAMQAEADRIKTIYVAVEDDAAKYASWEAEYYYAAKTYLFLKQQGFNDAVVCAILGNMMIETSGGSLALKPTIYSPGGSFYGLCQWSLYYRPNVAGMSFENQLTYLLNDLEYEFNTFGYCYKRGFSYEDFLEMEDPSEAAYVFAKVYERCGSESYNARRTSARKAYDYFVNNI